MLRLSLLLGMVVCVWTSYASMWVFGDSSSRRAFLTNGCSTVTFTQNGSFCVTESGTVDILLVGGGGGGGEMMDSDSGIGGGGAGGVVYRQSVALAAGTYTVTVGSGGAIGVNGGDTAISGLGLTAYGGGHGARSRYDTLGTDGASGGGAAMSMTTTQVAGRSPISGGAAIHSDNLGHAGGGSLHVYGAGGGGGAGAEGQYTGSSQPGVGGAGWACDITGREVYYAGGGGAYRLNGNNKAAGGIGGGGRGGEPGVNGLGGGGGGGAAGGSGLVVIRFATPREPMADSDDFAITGSEEKMYLGEESYIVFTNSGTLTVSGSGSLEILAVGGGGGGGIINNIDRGVGGGGGGGVLHLESVPVVAGTYPIVVGAGGAAGANGGDSIACGLTAYGGGAGAGPNGAAASGGGSGGGATCDWTNMEKGTPIPGGTALYLHEYVMGHDGAPSVQVYGSGGGGGAGEPGGPAEQGSHPGKGGDGVYCDITGRHVCYGGGGAGSRYQNVYPNTTPIAGGGGMSFRPGVDGLGGGGSGDQPGGSGIVVVRCRKAVPFVDELDGAEGGEVAKWRNYHVHTFTNNGVFTMPVDAQVELLMVGGGGGGGDGKLSDSMRGGAGGGAGGLIHTNVILSAGAHVVKIGAGGAPGQNGGDTIAFGFFAYGGGAGAMFDGRDLTSVENADSVPNGTVGNGGGSGGGSTHVYGNTGDLEADYRWVDGGSALYLAEGVRGNAGGRSRHVYNPSGGGGAGSPGCDSDQTTSPNLPGKGGDGYPCSITGTETYYAGGGAGARAPYVIKGGLGGGGDSTKPGVDGLGGGGGGGAPGSGAKGGSGVVIIRYKLKPKGTVLFVR